MATFTYIPDIGAQVEYKLRFKEAKFGDGYEQRYADGLNSVSEVWSLAFTNRDNTDIDAIITFLKARAGVEVFDWETPNGDTLKFRCKQFSKGIPVNGVISDASAVFEQVFDN